MSSREKLKQNQLVDGNLQYPNTAQLLNVVRRLRRRSILLLMWWGGGFLIFERCDKRAYTRHISFVGL